MGKSEEKDAFFDQNVRRVIRNCALVTCPLWIPVLGALGTWLYDMNKDVGKNTANLARVGVQVEYIHEYIKSIRK